MPSIKTSLTVFLILYATAFNSAHAFGDGSRIFRSFDENSNGYIEAEEITNFRLQQFTKADKNQDGVLTEDEFEKLGSRFKNRSPDSLIFSTVDTNQDLAVSENELLEAKSMIDLGDTDSDNALSLEEFQAVIKNLKEKRKAK